MVLESWTFLDMFWTMIVFFLWVMWFWLVIATFGDIFSRRDMSGWAKAGWTAMIIFIPFLGILIYLIVRPKPTEAELMRAANYGIPGAQVAAASTPATEIAKLSELKASGAITEEEYQALKAKAMS